MIVVPEKNAVLLKVRNPAAIAAVIPMCKAVSYKGHNLAVRHGPDEVRVLRNLGIQVPAPIIHRYDWPGKYVPFAHQKVTAAEVTLYKRLFVLNEMGTSKTAAVLWACDYLMRIGAVRRVLVVAPLSTLTCVWLREIFDVLMHRSAVVLHGTRTRRVESLQHQCDFYIVNHEGVQIVSNALHQHRPDIDMVVVDECSAYRNAGTDRYTALSRYVLPHHRLVMMSGAPLPNAPTDAWAQARLVDPSRVPRYFTAFKRQTMYQISGFKWEPKPEGETLAYNALQPGIRFKKADCIDLPPLLYQDRTVLLTQEQQDAFKAMKRDMVATVAAAGGVENIAAVNAADAITKLRQIACGVVRVPNTDRFAVLDYTPRFAELMNCISQSSGKVIVVVPFKGIVHDLQARISPHFSTEVVNGDVSITQRNSIFSRFQTDPDPHVLLCHPRVMSHGLTLTAANCLIFFGPIYSNDAYQQVKDRINRPGQTQSMTIIRFGGPKIEWDIYEALEARQLGQNRVLDMFKTFVYS